MSIKQLAAIQLMEKAAGGKVIMPSLCEIADGWVALAEVAKDKKLVAVCGEKCPALALWKAETTSEEGQYKVLVMALNSNNAAVIRRYVKWTAPSACGAKGLSVGFSDWVGAAGANVAPLFAKKMIKPVLVEYTAQDSLALKRNFLEAVDAATWGVFEAGFKEGYGANAAGLTTEEEIVKGLLYGYSMIGLDCSGKINLEIEKMDDVAVAVKYNEFPEEFREAMEGSYLQQPAKVMNQTITFTPEVLRRAVLEYGEAIMHAQFIYNSYLKNTPWDIDFEVYLSKKGKLLSPQEHYLVGNELTRNAIKLTAVGLNAAEDQEALATDLVMHAAIAESCGYRLSFAKADAFAGDLGEMSKTLHGKAYFKLGNVLWLAGLQVLAEAEPQLFAQIAAAAGLAVCTAAELEPTTPMGAAYGKSYEQVLAPDKGNMAGEIRTALVEHNSLYQEKIANIVKKSIKNL